MSSAGKTFSKMIKFKQHDIGTIKNHPEFAGRLAIVAASANSYGACWVYLFGKPINNKRYVLRLDQMTMHIERGS